MGNLTRRETFQKSTTRRVQRKVQEFRKGLIAEGDFLTVKPFFSITQSLIKQKSSVLQGKRKVGPDCNFSAFFVLLLEND